MVVIVNGQEITLTNDTIQKTKEYFIDNAKQCIDDAVNGVVTVNDLEKCVRYYLDRIEKIKSYERYSLAFIQKAVEIQTGVCCAILPL